MFFNSIYMSKPSRTEVAYDSNRIIDNTNLTNKDIKKPLKMNTENIKFYHTNINNTSSSINTKI